LTLACIGTDYRSTASAEPLSKPLDLTRFMQQSTEKSIGRATKKRHEIRRPVAKSQEQPTTTPPPEPAPFPVEAAAAVQPEPPVRVVASDELNEIDIISGRIPVGSKTAAPITENAVKLVEASEFNEIDRKADDLRPAAFETAPPDGENPARGYHAGGSRFQQAWAVLQSAFAAIAAAVQ
jgi:hypothetical protein